MLSSAFKLYYSIKLFTSWLQKDEIPEWLVDGKIQRGWADKAKCLCSLQEELLVLLRFLLRRCRPQMRSGKMQLQNKVPRYSHDGLILRKNTFYCCHCGPLLVATSGAEWMTNHSGRVWILLEGATVKETPFPTALCWLSIVSSPASLTSCLA